MPFVAVPSCVELAFNTTWGGEQTQNSIGVLVAPTPTQAQCDAIANIGLGWWASDVVPLTPSTLVLREAHVRDLTSITGLEASAQPVGVLSGTNGSPSLPNNVSICASIRTGHIGRSARGRWYWQGLSESQVTDSIVLSTLLPDIHDALVNLAGLLAVAGFNWVIISRFTGGLPRDPTPITFAVTDVVFVDAIVDSQRRRLPGRGS